MPILGTDIESVHFAYNEGVNSDDNNGGGATKTAWDGGSPTDFMNADGGPTSTSDTWDDSQSACITEAATGGEIQLDNNGSDGFAACVSGSLAYVEFSNPAYTDGYYVITVVDDDNIFLNNTTHGISYYADVRVGGAKKTMFGAVDNDGADAESYNKHVLVRGDETLGANVTLSDVYGGGLNSFKTMAGADSSWVPVDWYTDGDDVDTFPTINTGTYRIINYSTSTLWYGINVSGATAFASMYESTSSADRSLVANCKMVNTNGTGSTFRGYCALQHCYLRGASTENVAYIQSSLISDCMFESTYNGVHSKGVLQINAGFTATSIDSCIFVGASQGVGLYIGSLANITALKIRNCTFYNLDTGIYFSSAMADGTNGGLVITGNLFHTIDEYAVENTYYATENFSPWCYGNGFYNATNKYRVIVPSILTDLDITCSVDPFVGSGDLSLNDTANGGALLRAANIMNDHLDEINNSFVDIGLQHEDSGGNTTIIVIDD